MGGGGNEHFCLRWNDFESNISHAFREIRDEKDFFDVTLACEDEQVQAHKVILSACSPFFRKILRKNPHQHPLLFLKGVKYAEIVAILNFMYHGEVNVTQDDLNAFLAVAEELKVKGLTQNDQKQGSEQPARVQEPPQRRIREPPDAPPPPKKPRTVPETGVAPPPPPHPPVKTEPLAVPEVLLDEPFNGLDAGGVDEVLALIKTLNRDFGTSFLLSSHQLPYLQSVCSHLSILHGGHIVASGSLEELLQGSDAKLIVRTPDIARAQALLEQLDGILSVVSDTGSLTVTLATAKPAAVNQALVSAGIPVDELVHVRASVESLFRELTSASTDKSNSRAIAS